MSRGSGLFTGLTCELLVSWPNPAASVLPISRRIVVRRLIESSIAKELFCCSPILPCEEHIFYSGGGTFHIMGRVPVMRNGGNWRDSEQLVGRGTRPTKNVGIAV